MKKLIISCLLIVCMLVSLAPFGASAAIITEAEPWNGRTAQPFAGGSGTEADPYQIENGAQLYYLQQQSTTAGFYKLTRNINLGNKIFPAIEKFTGTLDGDGFRITNLRLTANSAVDVALIKECTGTVKNLTLEGSVDGQKSCAALAITLTGKVLNCTNDCTVTSTGGDAAGLVVTVNTPGQCRLCTNRGAITGKTAGGIAAKTSGSVMVEKDKNAPVTRCCNIGSISGQQRAGGVLGYQYYGTVPYCVNTGTVVSEKGVAGGIVGTGYSENNLSISYVNNRPVEHTSKHASYLHDCYNTGTVTGYSKAGGIAGEFYRHSPRYGNGGGQAYGVDCVLELTYNIGTVTATSASGKYGNIIGNVEVSGTNYLPTGNGNLYISDKNPDANVLFGTAYSDDEMQGVGAYSLFDLADTWTWDDTGAYNYPILQTIGLPPVLCAEHAYVHTDSVGDCGANGYQVYTCEHCGDTYKDYTNTIEHVFGDWATEQPATCTAAGVEARACKHCGARETRELPVLAHQPELRNVVEATCTAPGYSGDDYCAECNKLLQRGHALPAKGHTWGDWTVVTPATEDAEGSEMRTCSVCQETETRAIAKLPHTHKLTAVAKANATCTESGTEAYWACSKCGKLYSDAAAAHEIAAPVVIPALGHAYKDVVTAPNCTERGYTTHTCTRCGDSYVDTYTDALGHMTEVRGDKDATCTEPGYTGDDVCTVCGETVKKGAEIPALGHIPQLTGVKDVTCTEDGYTGDEVCGVCGEILHKGDVIPAKGHQWSDWAVTTPATEDEEGVAARTCSVCGAEQTRALPKLPHTHKLTAVAKVEPTCTAEGAEAYWRCDKCGKYFSDAKAANEIEAPAAIPALGHDYKDVVTAPTCTEKGYTTHTCSRCGDSFTDTDVDATGHTTKLQNAKEPTCTESGYTGDEVCTVCGETVKQGTEIAAKGHEWSEWTVTKAATETEEGEESRMCARCGEIETRKLDKLPPKPVTNPFTDVPEDQYYYDAVLWAVNHEPQITNGTSRTTFSPDATCTRGQVVTFLWRAKGEPEPRMSFNPFSDVAEDQYYYKAVLWAVEQGITNGTSKTTFSPNDPCTRAHVVTFLWRAEEKPAAGSANPFSDVPAGQYYTDAVLWAVSKNITNGTSKTTFSPNNPCTRGQIVTFLYRDMK